MPPMGAMEMHRTMAKYMITWIDAELNTRTHDEPTKDLAVKYAREKMDGLNCVKVWKQIPF
jgi:hypothetical protein